MGYYVSLESSSAGILERDLDKAYEAMCELNKRDDLKHGGGWSGGHSTGKWFSWMPENYPDELKTAEQILTALGFELSHGEIAGEKYLKIDRYDNKTGQEDLFIHACAPWIIPGSEMVWRGEDGERWRWSWMDGKMYLWNGINQWAGPYAMEFR
jgi:hypothetical protein